MKRPESTLRFTRSRPIATPTIRFFQTRSGKLPCAAIDDATPHVLQQVKTQECVFQEIPGAFRRVADRLQAPLNFRTRILCIHTAQKMVNSQDRSPYSGKIPAPPAKTGY
jgi:hypothetical protein